MAGYTNAVYNKNRLPLRVRELARMVIALDNECVVCQNTRDSDGIAAGVDEDLYDHAAEWRTWPGYSPQERIAAGEAQALVDVAEAVDAGEDERAGGAVAPAAGDSRRLVVVRGDNLWNIAQAHYGHGTHHTVIYGANKEQIRDPDLIYPGQVLSLPKVN